MTGLEIVVLVAVSFVGLFAVWVHGYSRGEIAGRYAAEREQRIRNLEERVRESNRNSSSGLRAIQGGKT